MLVVYRQGETTIEREEIIDCTDDTVLKNALWIDLITPTKKEEALVEDFLDIDIPTKKEMQEIEPSNRLYKEGGNLFMTITMVEKSESHEPRTDAVTFILTDHQFLTVRYIEPHSFELFISRLTRSKKKYKAINLLFGLLEATIDRLADILEKVSHNLDDYSQHIFHSNGHQGPPKKPLNYRRLLQSVGANGDIGAKTRESLVSLNRMISFLKQSLGKEITKSMHADIEIIAKDVEALSDHATFIANKVSFLLSATLGMVNIEQNDIIKIFSVAAVIFLPPTLIASIYGMNFKFIPELTWHFGYPIAILLMLLSAYLPYRYFKQRKWL